MQGDERINRGITETKFAFETILPNCVTNRTRHDSVLQ